MTAITLILAALVGITVSLGIFGHDVLERARSLSALTDEW